MTEPIHPTGQDPFIYHAPTENQIQRIQSVRAACRALYEELLASVGQSRERSLALTKLEEVSMWANKAITFEK